MTIPLDRPFYAQLESGAHVRVEYWPEGSAWAGRVLFSATDGDGESYSEDEMTSWSIDKPMTREETEYRAHLDRLEDYLVQATIAVRNARIAADRSWIGEKRQCHAAMTQVQRLARLITDAAIDAEVEAK